MTTDQYNSAKNRIAELLNPEIQPINIDLAWELNDLMKAVNNYEDIHHPEYLAKAEIEAEVLSQLKGIPFYNIE